MNIRKDGPTPNGGAYSIAYYLDKDRAPTDPKDAVFLIICEYDKNDNLLFETTGISSKKKKRGQSNEEFTDIDIKG